MNLAKEKVAHEMEVRSQPKVKEHKEQVRYVCAKCQGEFRVEEMTVGHKAGGVGSYCLGCKRLYNLAYRAKHQGMTLREAIRELQVAVERLAQQESE
jgi:hypothetical protein